MSVYSSNKLNKNKPNDAWFKIFQLIKPNTKILDVGCSSGELGAALKKEKAAYVVGLDIDQDDIALAREKIDETYLINIEQDSIEKLGKFDVIIMADVIEHLLDPVSALKKLKKALNPGGSLVFSIPNMANATIRIELLKGRFEYRDWGLLDRTHLHFYDLEEVQRVFRESGFKVAKTDCTIRNIPKNILVKELATIGVDVTDGLIEYLNQPEALMYQFIGCAEVGSGAKKLKPQTTSSLDSVTREIDFIRQEQAKQLAAMLAAKDNEIAQGDQKLKKALEQLSALTQQLDEVYSSRGWKVLGKYRSIVSRLRK